MSEDIELETPEKQSENEHSRLQMQHRFVEVYWEQVEAGVPEREALKTAKIAAGYADSYPIRLILQTVEKYIVKKAQENLVLSLPKTLNRVKYVLDDPEYAGSKRLLEVATLIFDRAGVAKKEQVEMEIKTPDGIALFPAKNKIKE